MSYSHQREFAGVTPKPNQISEETLLSDLYYYSYYFQIQGVQNSWYSDNNQNLFGVVFISHDRITNQCILTIIDWNRL